MMQGDTGGQWPGADEGYLDASKAVAALWRARWVVAGVVLTCGVAGFLLGATQPRQYEAQVRLRAVQSINGTVTSLPQTMVTVLRGPELAAAAQDESGRQEQATPDAPVSRSATIEEMPPSSVCIRVRTTDPATATALATRYGRAAVDLIRRENERTHEKAEVVLTRRVAAARARLDQAREHLREVSGKGVRGTTKASDLDEGAVADAPASRRYSAADAEFDSRWLDVKVAELAFRDAAVRNAQYLERLEWESVELALVEGAGPAYPLSRGRLRRALLGVGLGVVLSLIGVFALLVARPLVARSRA